MNDAIDFQVRNAEAVKVNPHDVTKTEDGIAQAFAIENKDKFRYCHHNKAWFLWNGVYWQRSEKKEVFHAIRLFLRGINDENKPSLAKASTADAVEKYAQRDARLAVTSEVWDRDPLLLGTPDGTVDLRNGHLLPSHPDDFITKKTSVTPANTADARTFFSFLHDATQGDADLQLLLQRCCGYLLTGMTIEQVLLFLYGPGGNGKSVFLNAINNIMGEYSQTAPMGTFTASKSERHPADLAMLQGARMVSASETEEGQAWAEAKIKSLTGGDPISARFMRGNFFTFVPQFKLIIVGNHKPILHSVDDAARRRFIIIPFIHKPEDPDTQLEEKLIAEYPAILRWMIDGCVDWQKNGLPRPAVVDDATAEYFDDQDMFGRWLEECCDAEPANNHKFETASKLYSSWKIFAERNGEHPGSSKAFGSRLQQAGFERKKMVVIPGQGQRRCYLGISVKFDPTASGIDQ